MTMFQWLVRPFRRASTHVYAPLPDTDDRSVRHSGSPPDSLSDSHPDSSSDPAEAEFERSSSVSSAEDLDDVPETPLPKMALFVLCLMRTSEPIALTQIMPYIQQYLQFLLPGVPHEDLGYYAGIVESAFSAAQACVVLLWGRVSDRYGRKPILILGLVGVFISINSFGLAHSFPALIAARLIAGFSNGNIGVLKASIAELTDSTNQARAFAFIPLSFALGSVVGPYIGSALADPYGVLNKEGKYLPGREHDPRFFARYPFYLPCLVASLFNLAAIVLGVFCLRETLTLEPPDSYKPPRVERQPVGRSPAQASPVSPAKGYGTLSPAQRSREATEPPSPVAPNSLASEAEVQRWRRGIPQSSPSDDAHHLQRQRRASAERRLSSLYQDGVQTEGSALTISALSRADERPKLGRSRSSAWDLVAGTKRDKDADERVLAPPLHVHSPSHYFHQRPKSASHASLSASGGGDHSIDNPEQEPNRLVAPPLRSLMTADVFSVIFTQMILNFLNISYMALLPLFCYTWVEHGGIGFRRSDIGHILGATGILSIAVQLGLLPSFMRWSHGALGLIRRAVPLQALVWLCFPLAQVAAQSALQHHQGPWLVWVCVGTMVLLKVLTNTSLVAATVLINQHAPSRAALGTINGLSAMCGSLSRTIGPAASTSLFAYSAAQDASFLRREVIWLTQIAISFLCFWLTLRIPPTKPGR